MNDLDSNKGKFLLFSVLVSALVFFVHISAYAEVVSARIVSYHLRDDSTYSIGNNIPISVKVSALGRHLDTLYAIFIIKDSDGNFFDSKIERLRIWHSDELTGVTLDWQVPITASEGWYSIIIEIRNGIESDVGDITLLEKFDSIEIPHAFEVKYDYKLSGKINSIVFDKTKYENGEELTASVRLLLGGNPHTYYLTAELVGSNGSSLKIPHEPVSTTPYEMALHDVAVRFEWLIPEGLHDTYDVSVKLWSEYDDMSGRYIGNLDSYYISDAFKIEPTYIAISLADNISVTEKVEGKIQQSQSDFVSLSPFVLIVFSISLVAAIVIRKIVVKQNRQVFSDENGVGLN